MKPSQKNVAEMERLQEDFDANMLREESEELKKQAERANRAELSDAISKALKIAERVACYNGGHAYLGRDALTRDYHSDWIPLGASQDDSSLIVQVKLERNYRIKRQGTMETGQNFTRLDVDMRLYDAQREVATEPDNNVMVFKLGEVTVKREDEHVVTIPGDENWQGVCDFLEELEQACSKT